MKQSNDRILFEVREERAVWLEWVRQMHAAGVDFQVATKKGYRKTARKDRMDDENWRLWNLAYPLMRNLEGWIGRDPLHEAIKAAHPRVKLGTAPRLHEGLKIMWVLGQVDWVERSDWQTPTDKTNHFYRLTARGRRKPLLRAEQMPLGSEATIGPALDRRYASGFLDLESLLAGEPVSS